MEEVAPPSFFSPEDPMPLSSTTGISSTFAVQLVSFWTDQLSLAVAQLFAKVAARSGSSITCAHLCSVPAATIIRPPPALVVTLLKELMVHCTNNCGKMVKLESYINHIKYKCCSHYEVIDLPLRMTMSEVLSRTTTCQQLQMIINKWVF